MIDVVDLPLLQENVYHFYHNRLYDGVRKDPPDKGFSEGSFIRRVLSTYTGYMPTSKHQYIVIPYFSRDQCSSLHPVYEKA